MGTRCVGWLSPRSQNRDRFTRRSFEVEYVAFPPIVQRTHNGWGTRCVGWLSPRSQKRDRGHPQFPENDGCILGRGSILKAVFDDEEAVLPVESEGTELCLLMD